MIFHLKSALVALCHTHQPYFISHVTLLRLCLLIMLVIQSRLTVTPTFCLDIPLKRLSHYYTLVPTLFEYLSGSWFHPSTQLLTTHFPVLCPGYDYFPPRFLFSAHRKPLYILHDISIPLVPYILQFPFPPLYYQLRKLFSILYDVS